jgi:hypothetical protein
MDGYDKKYCIRNIQLGWMDGWDWDENIQSALESDTPGLAVYTEYLKLPDDKSFSILQ